MTRIEATVSLAFLALLAAYDGWLATPGGARRAYGWVGGPESLMWFWLRLFRIERTEQSCTRFVRFMSVSVIAIAVLGMLTILYVMVFGPRSG